MKACFFANAPMDMIEKVEFYKNDIRILKELEFEVKVANKLRNIPWDCDIYFAWWASSGTKALLISKLLRKPCIIVAGGSDVSLKDRSPAGYNQRSFFQKLIIKWTLKHAYAILAVSKDVYEDAALLGAKNLHLVYNCIDTEKYKPVKAKKEDIVLSISHLSKQNIERKGLKSLINSMPTVLKKHPRAKLILVGKKLDAYDELLNMAKDLKIEKSIEFPGFVSEKQKIVMYNKAKVFASPSEHEGFGVAIAEAMACGTPVIVTHRGAVPEVVGDTGLYVKFGNIHDISRFIIRILDDNTLSEALGRKSRERIKKFGVEKRKEGISGIIEKINKR